LIHYLTHKIFSSLIVACLTLIGFYVIMGDYSYATSAKVFLVLIEGLVLDYFCFKNGILGQKTHMPLVVFSVLSVLLMPALAFGDLVYGAVCLSAFFLAFEAGNNPEKAPTLMMLFGVLLGIAQAVSNISILLMLPFFVLFRRTGIREPRSFILSIVYFLMVVFSYLGLLFVMELSPQMRSLIPSLSVDYSVFNTILFKFFVPYALLCIVIHFLGINSYLFRYPNKSKILNYTMLIQAAIAVALILLTAEMNLMIYVLMSSTVLLSFAFVYNRSSVFVNAAFASLVAIAFGALYLYKILIL
jgi:hypothetical protein